jgi:hypothetical protein
VTFEPGRPFCAEVARAHGEPLAATASRVEHWLVLEYRGLWARDALEGSTLTPDLRARLGELLAVSERSRLLFARRPRRPHEELLGWVARSTEGHEALRRVRLGGYDDLLGLDPGRDGEDVEHPLFLVCTHGKHDRCCARYGRPLYEALCDVLDDEWIWQCTHLGGDRFAGNLLVLPWGLYFGRVEPADTVELVEEVLSGRIPLDLYRGRSSHPFPAQAAERAVREATGLCGIDDVRLTGLRRAGRGWTASATTAGGREWEVGVERVEGEPLHLTCSAAELRRPRRYVAGSPRARAA